MSCVVGFCRSTLTTFARNQILSGAHPYPIRNATHKSHYIINSFIHAGESRTEFVHSPVSVCRSSEQLPKIQPQSLIRGWRFVVSGRFLCRWCWLLFPFRIFVFRLTYVIVRCIQLKLIIHIVDHLPTGHQIRFRHQGQPAIHGQLGLGRCCP